MAKVKLKLNHMKLNLKSLPVFGLLLYSAFSLCACSSNQPDFKFIKFHSPSIKASASTSHADSHESVKDRAIYKRRLLASGFKISHVGKWVQLDCPRSLLFKTESASYRYGATHKINLVRAYMSTFAIEGLNVSVYGAPPKPPAFEQALTNLCAINIVNSLNDRQHNLPAAVAFGYGVNDPVALNNTAHGRNTNKRITIRFELEQSDLQLI